MAGASRILLPESGQSALGSSLVPSGQNYPHYGAHPLFAQRMESLLHALFGRRIRIEIPRLWSTKGQTLHELLNRHPDAAWHATKSCWKGNRHSSANGSWRQCGVCSACMLRRLSLHAAGLKEAPGTYGSDNLNASNLTNSLIPGYRSASTLKDDAIAGVRSLTYLAEIAKTSERRRMWSHAVQLSTPLGLPPDDIFSRLTELAQRHALEWNAFLESLHPNSFVRIWANLNS